MQDVPSSWIQLDIGPGRLFRISAYTLRHGSNSKQDFIRNWTLKGSTDGKTFDTLLRHKDDENISGQFASYTWLLEIEKPYRYFRIIQVGHNSSVCYTHSNPTYATETQLFVDIRDRALWRAHWEDGVSVFHERFNFVYCNADCDKYDFNRLLIWLSSCPNPSSLPLL